MGIREWFAKRITGPASRKQDRLSLIPRWLTGQPLWHDWSTETAVDEGLKSSVWVYRCCQAVAKAIASVPWQVEVTSDDGETWEPEPGHPIEILLRDSNPFMTGSELSETQAYHLLLGGNAIWHLPMVRKMPVEIWPLQPDKVKPVPGKQGFVDRYEYRINSVKETDIPPEEIIHFKFVDPGNPYWGLAPLQAGAKIVDSDIEAVNWNKVAMQNRGVTDGVFSFKEPMTKDQWDKARDMIREQHQGADNARMPWVLGNDAAWQQMSLSPAEMDFLESRKLNMYEIHAIFGVDPLLTGAPDHSGRANKAEARKAFWEDTVLPMLDSITETLNLNLIPFWHPESMRAEIQPNLQIV